MQISILKNTIFLLEHISALICIALKFAIRIVRLKLALHDTWNYNCRILYRNLHERDEMFLPVKKFTRWPAVLLLVIGNKGYSFPLSILLPLLPSVSTHWSGVNKIWKRTFMARIHKRPSQVNPPARFGWPVNKVNFWTLMDFLWRRRHSGLWACRRKNALRQSLPHR